MAEEEEEENLFLCCQRNELLSDDDDDKNMTHKQVNAHVFSRYIILEKPLLDSE